MKRQIIITDLTRFGEGKPIVCTAGIDPETGECIRPKPYLQFAHFTRLGIFPGGILMGDFEPDPSMKAPHTEDARHKDLKFLRPCNAEEFQSVLQSSASPSLEAGFGVSLPDGAKVIPLLPPPSRSIITLKVDPLCVEIVEDSYKTGKLRIHFTDGAGKRYRFFSITDLGFHDYAQRHRESGALNELNAAIAEQDVAYLRIGLGQPYKNPQGKEGFWMQANGIYTFPSKLSYIRSYLPSGTDKESTQP
jgi:hypothetical protein